MLKKIALAASTAMLLAGSVAPATAGNYTHYDDKINKYTKWCKIGYWGPYSCRSYPTSSRKLVLFFDGCNAGGVNKAAGSIYSGLRSGSCEEAWKILWRPV